MSAVNDQQKALLAPAVALLGWTFFMEAWMYATRLPAIFNGSVKVNSNSLRIDMDRQMPPSVRWKADNYNHLHEQPLLFYVVTLILVFLSQGSSTTSKLGLSDNSTGVTGLDAGIAWTYVGTRVVHSFVQALANPIPIRFSVFVTSSFVLLGLTLRTARLVF